MLDRYTERARRVLFFARYEVSVLGGETIEPEHILLGLLRESKGTIDRLLAIWNIPIVELRHQIEQRATHRTKIPTSVEVSFAETTQRLLNLAAEEADRLRSPHIEPAHLLLALLRANDSVATSALTRYGMTLDAARERVASDNATVPDADLVQSPNPLADAHIERSMQLVRELAETDPNSAEAQNLVARIDEELMMLRLSLG